ncbi:MAG: alkaline phosphatase PhoX [Planctomycetota bacterium]
MNTRLSSAALVAATLATSALAQDPSMIQGYGWRTEAFLTIGDTVDGYTPPGILDGIAAYPTRLGRVLVLVNHELGADRGYAYTLANGTALTGARISAFEVSRTIDGKSTIHTAGLAYDRVYDRQGNIVTDASQINETGNGANGFGRFCSSQGVRAGTYGFVDDVYFTGEEVGTPGHPHGGSIWVVDVRNAAFHAAPELGRGGWENVTAVDTGDPTTVGLLLGDDTSGAPLYLYVGQKGAAGDGSFLDRNGLKVGQMHVWTADNGDASPQEFNGAGSSRTGRFVPINVRDVAQAGTAGYDVDGYLNDSVLRAAGVAAGGFRFSRPEDLDTNPADGTQVAFASTGRGSTFPADNWGTTYIVDLDFGAQGVTATIEIVADADGIQVPDMGIRNPDNLCWSADGHIYIQEDRSTSPSSLFGAVSGRDASIWRLDPSNGSYVRIGEVNRTVILPVGSTDPARGTLGVPETSGIIDVTSLFPTMPGETLLLADVQAHGIRDGLIGGNANLAEGGQMVFLTNRGIDHATKANDVGSNVAISFDVTNGASNNGYAVILAFQNAGNAPNGWFYGVDVTFAEFDVLTPPLLGVLDVNGDASFSFTLPGSFPIGLTFDSVVVEVGSNGTPVGAGPAVTTRL